MNVGPNCEAAVLHKVCNLNSRSGSTQTSSTADDDALVLSLEVTSTISIVSLSSGDSAACSSGRAALELIARVVFIIRVRWLVGVATIGQGSVRPRRSIESVSRIVEHARVYPPPTMRISVASST